MEGCLDDINAGDSSSVILLTHEFGVAAIVDLVQLGQCDVLVVDLLHDLYDGLDSVCHVDLLLCHPCRIPAVVAGTSAVLWLEVLAKVAQHLGAATVESVDAEFNDTAEVGVTALLLLVGALALVDEAPEESSVGDCVV